MRRLLGGLSSFIVMLAVLAGMAPQASAADLGTVTFAYNIGSHQYELVPAAISGGAGDTFTFSNTTGSIVHLVNAGGQVTDLAGATTVCSSTDCPVTSGGSMNLRVDSAGTIQVRDSNGISVLANLVIGSSMSVTDPTLVYPTMYLNANGGTCTGESQYTKVNGMNGTVTLPTAEQCSRTGYTLDGWARSSSSTSSVFAPGSVVPIGDESFTLFAVWKPVGVEVTYGAGVADGDECLTGGSSAATRVSIVVVPITGSLATQAPCSPPLMVLSGWRDLSSGTVFAPGDALSRLGASTGSRVSLAAQWKVTYGLTVEASAATLAPEATTTVVVTATVNGTPASGAAVELAVPDSSPFVLAGGSSPMRVTMNATGQAQVAVVALPARTGAGTLTAAFGDRVSSVTIEVQNAPAPSVVITGERTTVSGKPGIRIDGIAVGLPAGTQVIPYFRFPGETSYVQGSARPVVGANGEFTWQRKTGKKFYAYVVTNSGVSSNRVIIPAN